MLFKIELFQQKKLDIIYSFRSESVTNNNDTKSGSYLIIEESVKRYETGKGLVELQRPIRGSDEALLKVYNCEKEYATVKLPVSASVSE